MCAVNGIGGNGVFVRRGEGEEGRSPRKGLLTPLNPSTLWPSFPGGADDTDDSRLMSPLPETRQNQKVPSVAYHSLKLIINKLDIDHHIDFYK